MLLYINELEVYKKKLVVYLNVFCNLFLFCGRMLVICRVCDDVLLFFLIDVMVNFVEELVIRFLL